MEFSVCDDEVKLLGITIDFKLNFYSHIINICKKAARQLNILRWIGKHLDRFGKLFILFIIHLLCLILDTMI